MVPPKVRLFQEPVNPVAKVKFLSVSPEALKMLTEPTAKEVMLKDMLLASASAPVKIVAIPLQEMLTRGVPVMVKLVVTEVVKIVPVPVHVIFPVPNASVRTPLLLELKTMMLNV